MFDVKAAAAFYRGRLGFVVRRLEEGFAIAYRDEARILFIQAAL